MEEIQQYDCCIVGSGAGAGPVAYELSKAGYKVVILEKGQWYKEKDFRKDDQLSRHSVFRSKFREERHVLEEPDGDDWSSNTTSEFWGGNIVGGASNFMSAYFHRLKPQDFRLLSTFGPIEGANQVDWPISYDDMEPYYSKVEKIVGVSGKIVKHPFLEPRSTPDYPFPPTNEHPISSWFDKPAIKWDCIHYQWPEVYCPNLLMDVLLVNTQVIAGVTVVLPALKLARAHPYSTKRWQVATSKSKPNPKFIA